MTVLSSFWQSYVMALVQDDRFPQPPAGYQPAERFQYPRLRLQVAALAVLALTTPVLLFSVWVLQRGSAARPFVLVSGGMDLLPIAVTALATTTVHELVHGATYRLLGYRVTFGVSRHLLAADFPTWTADECPLCRDGVPIAKPGSRPIS